MADLPIKPNALLLNEPLAQKSVLRTRGRNDNLTVTRFSNDGEGETASKSFCSSDAYEIVLPVSSLRFEHEWDGVRRFHDGNATSAFNIYDLNPAPSYRMFGPFDKLRLHITRAALDDLADDVHAQRIERLVTPEGWDTVDPVINGLKRVLLLAFEQQENMSSLFVDHILFALHAHIARFYGDMRDATRQQRGGLAPWQERRAKDLIAANLNKQLSLLEIADECGLSSSHFTRAFKASTGITPHCWLQTCRVDQAKALLGNVATPLAEIGLACGFADQSHFSRVFARIAGNTPGAWRRLRR